jgi:hypothetical protein
MRESHRSILLKEWQPRTVELSPASSTSSRAAGPGC